MSWDEIVWKSEDNGKIIKREKGVRKCRILWVFKWKIIRVKHVKRVKINYFEDKEFIEKNDKIKRSDMSIRIEKLWRKIARY